MKVKYEVVNQRRLILLQIIKHAGSINTNELISKSDMSDVTIRRDLLFLESYGCIQRYHGGATYIKDLETSSNSEPENHITLIAKKAASFVENNDTIFINSSKTALQIIKYLHDINVTVITNNARAIYLEHDPLVSIHFTGGEIRFPKEVMVGELALNSLNIIRANKAFLGCSGLSLTSGITTKNNLEVSVNKLMIERSGEVFIVADEEKLGIEHSFVSGSLSKISTLITAGNPDVEFCEELKKQGINVVVTK